MSAENEQNGNEQEAPQAKILEMPSRTPAVEGDAAAAPPADGVRAFDQNGQPVIVPREEWRENVLPGMVKESWDSPEQLYLVIVNALNDNFFAEMSDAAQRLYETDPVLPRGASMWAIVLMQAKRLDEAEQVLAGYLDVHPADGSVLLNLAKVYAERGDGERAMQTLRRAVDTDPNLEHAVGWYAAAAGEQGGEPAARAALEEIAAMPHSWRAQLWLARAVLGAGEATRAREFYDQALERAPRPVPPELLMQMSGDLGTVGRLGELVELTRPHYIPEFHGLAVGNNLIKALVDLGDLDLALSIKRSLDPFNRPDWRESLAYWENEIGQRRGPGAPGAAEGGVQIGMLRVDGAVWLPPQSPAQSLFGAKTAGPAVTFLGGSAETPEQAEGEAPSPQLTDALGRMTRAVPLYLAEQVQMRTAAEGRAMLPWATGAASGFVVSGARWPTETAVAAVQEPANRSEYVVTVHVDAEVEPWTVELAFLRAADGVQIGELSAEFESANPESALPKLADEVVELLRVLGSAPTPEAYRVPQGSGFNSYLMHLEQLMAVRCAGIEGVPPQFLNGEREILSGEFDLCHAEPDNIAVRLLLVETMGALQRLRPEAVAEFGQQFQQLIEQKPLPALDRLFQGA